MPMVVCDAQTGTDETRSSACRVPLEIAISEWMSKLPPVTVQKHRTGLAKRKNLEMGSAFTGTGMAEHAMTKCIEWWNENFGLDLNLVHRFGCELNLAKRMFNTRQFNFDYMFANARDLSNV